MKKKTDFRALQARRNASLARPELRAGSKPTPVPAPEIAAAIEAGKLTRLPPGKRTRR